MIERRVRTSRGAYGRAMPLERPRRRARWAGPTLWQRRLLLLVVGLGLGVWGVASLFTITKLEVKAPGRMGEIESEGRKIVGESWLQGNMLTFDEEGFVSKLQRADPLLKSVSVQRKLFHRLFISVAFKQPSMGWSTDNQSYLVDVDGTVIGSLPVGSGLSVVTDGSNLPVTAGKQVVPPRFVSFVTALAPALRAEGIGVTGLSIGDTTLDLAVSTDKGYRLTFDTSRSVGEQMADLRAVRALLATQKTVPGEYIDLRIPGKAYYR